MTKTDMKDLALNRGLAEVLAYAGTNCNNMSL